MIKTDLPVNFCGNVSRIYITKWLGKSVKNGFGETNVLAMSLQQLYY